MKIYAIHTQGEVEWIYASTIFEALKYYHSINDLEIDDFDDDDDIEIVPEGEWDDMIITNPDEKDEKDETFANFMKGKSTGAGFVASTVY
jgi:hypothetical protein